MWYIEMNNQFNKLFFFLTYLHKNPQSISQILPLAFKTNVNRMHWNSPEAPVVPLVHRTLKYERAFNTLIFRWNQKNF